MIGTGQTARLDSEAAGTGDTGTGDKNELPVSSNLQGLQFTGVAMPTVILPAGCSNGRPCFNRLSERQPHRQIERAAVVEGVGDLAEISAAEIASRKCELRRVE